MISRADRRRDPAARTARCASSTTSRSPASQRCLAARAPRPSPSSSAARWSTFARHPDQWQKLLDDRSKIPAAVEELLRYVAPVQYNVRYSVKDVELHSVTIPADKPVFLMERRSPTAIPRAFDRRRHLRHRPRPLRGAEPRASGTAVHSCLGAALARMETRCSILLASAVERLAPGAVLQNRGYHSARGLWRASRWATGLHGHHPEVFDLADEVHACRTRSSTSPCVAAGHRHSRR